jgi:putative flippase GtrA
VTLAARPLWQRIVAELAAFGTVGVVCLVADITLFNLFVFGFGMPLLLAKCVGMVITGTMAFLGHRHVTFRHRHGGGHAREIPLFAIITVLTVVLSLLPLYLARHVLGTTSVAWLNIANLTGIGLATITRYLAYRNVVWAHHRVSGGVADPVEEAVAGDDARHLRGLEVEHELVGE